MQIGILNELLENLVFAVSYHESILSPQTEKNGNPLKNEPLVLNWNEVRDSDVRFHIQLSQQCFVDRVALKIGEHTALTNVILKRNKEVLFRYHAETNSTIKQKYIELEAGVLTDTLDVMVTGDFSDIEIQQIQLFGAIEDGLELFPIPSLVSMEDTYIPTNYYRAYVADSPQGQRAGDILAEKMKEKTGVSLMSVSDNSCKSGDIIVSGSEGVILLCSDENIGKDGYRLEVSEKKTCIYASGLKGFVQGAETFIKLINEKGIRAGSISDEPFMPFRGVHLFVPGAEYMDFAKRLIKYVLSPMGYNAIVMEVAAGMKYDSHPQININVENAIEKNKQGLWPPFPHGIVAEGKGVDKGLIRDLVAYSRSYGIDVIPEVQSLGHVSFMTHSYPEIAEINAEAKKEVTDLRQEDMRPHDFYPHCYCPSKDKSYEILFDLLDEIIEVFEPREYVHMGHDEVYEIGVCPICKQKDPAELFAMDINRIYEYLKKKGLKMMIWADMLQPVTRYKTYEAINMIPKDIVLMDFIWYFHLDKNIEDNLLNKGFPVVYGNLYSSLFPRFEERIKKEGIIGGLTSAWVCTNEKSLQQEGKFYDFIYTAQMLWSSCYAHEYRLTYDRLISKMMPKLREDLQEVKYPSLADGAICELLYENKISFPPQNIASGSNSFEVQGAYGSLIFGHTLLRRRTRMPWSIHQVLGRYILCYEDGTQEEIPITNSGNIGYWNRRHNQPLQHSLYRHNGYTCTYYTDGVEFKTANGEDVTIYRYEHTLPEDKKLVRVILEESKEYDARIFLYSVEGVKR